MVTTLFTEWRMPQEPSKKKRKKGNANAEEEEYDPEASQLFKTLKGQFKRMFEIFTHDYFSSP